MLIPVIGIQFHIFELFYIFVISILILDSIVFNKSRRLVTSNINIDLLFLFLLLYTAAILLSSINCYSIPFVLKSFFKWFEVFLLALLTFVYISNKSRFIWIYRFLFLSAAIFIFFVLFRVARGELLFLGYRIFPGIESVLAFGLLLPFVKSKHQLFIFTLLVLFLISTILSLSRSAYLPLVIIILIGYKYFDNKMRRKINILFILLLVFMLFNEITREYLAQRLDNFLFKTSLSNTERSNLLKIAWSAFIDHPIFGTGSLNLGQYIRANNLSHLIIAADFDIFQTHNVLLQIAAEEGIVGLSSFLLVMACTFVLIRNSFHKNNVDKRYLWGLVNFSIGLLSLILFGFITAQFRLLCGVFLGLVAAVDKSNVKDTF